MEDIVRIVRQAVESARRLAKDGLLYEAAYRCGQASAMIGMLYALHADGIVSLDEEAQGALARLRQRLERLADSLAITAGNGRHKMGSAESAAKKGLRRVVEMLREDVQAVQWL